MHTYFQTLGFVIITLLVQATCIQAQAQSTYRVIKVKGESIQNLSRGQLLAPNQEISSTDRLSFIDKKATAVLIDKNKFLYDLAYTTTSELVGNSIKKRRDKLMSQRGEYDVIDDLKEYLGDNTFHIIGSELKMRLAFRVYPLQDGHTFDMIVGEGASREVKTLATSMPDTLIISKDLFKQDTSYHKGLLMYRLPRQRAELRLPIQLTFIEDQEELEKSFRALKSMIIQEEMDYEMRKKEYLIYFQEVFGNTDLKTLERWLLERGFL